MLDLVAGDGILRMPHIVRDKLFNLGLPGSFQIVITNVLDLVHETLNILDKDIIACDEHALLRASAAASPRRGRSAAGLLPIRVRSRLGRRLGRVFS